MGGARANIGPKPSADPLSAAAMSLGEALGARGGVFFSLGSMPFLAWGLGKRTVWPHLKRFLEAIVVKGEGEGYCFASVKGLLAGKGDAWVQLLAIPLHGARGLEGFLNYLWDRDRELTGKELKFIQAILLFDRLAQETGAMAIVKAIIKERQRLRQELHDGLSQSLSYIYFTLGALEQSASGFREEISGVRSEVVKAADDLRKTLWGLTFPTISDSLAWLQAPLPELLLNCSQDFSRRNRIKIMATGTNPGGQGKDLAPAVKGEVVRIVQEALVNVAKHAQASQVVVRWHQGSRGMAVRIKDDGVGMDHSRQERKGKVAGLGLTGMQERAQEIGGIIAWRSRPGKGTRVILYIPHS